MKIIEFPCLLGHPVAIFKKKYTTWTSFVSIELLTSKNIVQTLKVAFKNMLTYSVSQKEKISTISNPTIKIIE